MGDPREPPEGTPEGGNEDEYRSVVFDEAFVRAARIQELSARERLGGYSRGVRPRIGFGPFGSLPRQAVALLLMVAMAFAAAVYFGVSSPRPQAVQPTGSQLSVTLVTLSPSSPVSAVADPRDPYAGVPGANGPAGLGVPQAEATAHFTKVEVTRALGTVQRFLVSSALTPAVLAQGASGDVRGLVTPGEQAQFDQSLATPSSSDLHHAATGWMVRFDPGQVALASDTVKVSGSVQVTEADGGTLEVTTDHTMVYALRPAGTGDNPPVTLFSVHRQLRFEIDRTDLADGQLRLVDALVQAGPANCGTDAANYLQPVLAGTATTGQAPQPSPTASPNWQVCGTLR